MPERFSLILVRLSYNLIFLQALSNFSIAYVLYNKTRNNGAFL
jgi:hypothetical protein